MTIRKRPLSLTKSLLTHTFRSIYFHELSNPHVNSLLLGLTGRLYAKFSSRDEYSGLAKNDFVN